jgi:Mor family transcriptional regulator
MSVISRSELQDHILRKLKLKGIPEALAEATAGFAVEIVWERCGKRTVYFAVGRLTASRRDQQIYEAYRGDNKDDLARQYNLSSRRIEQIIARQLRARRVVAPGHPPLFVGDES